MRTTTRLLGALVLIALGVPRAARCCGLGSRAAARSSPVATAVAPASAKPLSLRAVAKPLPAMEIALLDPNLPFRVLPTWSTIAGHSHAGFAISGRF